jgi:hypothetical protein
MLYCPSHKHLSYGKNDLVVPKELSMQVYQAWSQSTAAARCTSQGQARGEDKGVDELTRFFEHDGGHFLPATKQVLHRTACSICCSATVSRVARFVMP